MTPVWLFGKLPAHGDFVARGLPAAAREELDHWLAASLADARDALGGSFERSYDRAPPWRFAAEGVDGWTAGAMAPSVDGVGRRYPVLVARTGIAAVAVEVVAEQLEHLLYEALAGRWDADRLVAHAAGSAEPAAHSPWTLGERWWTLGCGVAGEWMFEQASLPGARPPALMRTVLAMQEGGA